MDRLASVIRGAGAAIAGLLVIGVVLYVLEANSGNWLAGSLLDASAFFATPFRGIFDFDENKVQIICNWGIAALVYALIGAFAARAVEAIGARHGSSSASSAGGEKPTSA